MTCHYPDLDSVSDWLCHMGNLIQPIRSTTQIWVVMCHQYGIAAHADVIWQGNQWYITKCQLFSQARKKKDLFELPRNKISV